MRPGLKGVTPPKPRNVMPATLTGVMPPTLRDAMPAKVDDVSQATPEGMVLAKRNQEKPTTTAEVTRPRAQIFLLSPADCSGRRALLLHRPEADHDLARRLRGREGAALGEVFAFVSSLYFRGKLAYARAFARPPRGVDGVLVITPGDGLAAPESPVTLEDLRRYSGANVDSSDERYRAPLLRDLRALLPRLDGADVVLLGSIASGKYVDLLTEALGARVLFPPDFVGRGDMSRGGLLLRCVREGRELAYVPLLGARRHGVRPPRLAPLRRGDPQGPARPLDRGRLS